MTVQFTVVGAIGRRIAFPAVHVQFAPPTVHKSDLLCTVAHEFAAPALWDPGRARGYAVFIPTAGVADKQHRLLLD